MNMVNSIRIQRNRIRLLYLLTIYPIYKGIELITQKNFTWAFILFGISVLYLLLVFYFENRMKKKEIAQ